MNKNVLKQPIVCGIKSFERHLFLLLFILGGTVFSVLPVTLNAQQTSQSWVLKGNVVDEKDQPIPGVTVRIKNTTRGAKTDIDGNFIIEISDAKDVLIFSYIGYKAQEVIAGTERVLKVKLLADAASELDQVVVVGYGTQKKATLTGAISSISPSELQRMPTPSLSNALGGKLPGVITKQESGEPGADAADVYIRGLASWVNSRPLILVDGVERDMNAIPPQEIESFYILKDASATAVYGVRGANGVVVITTKRGKVGKPVVNFRAESAVVSSTRLPEYINGSEYAGFVNEAMAYSGQVPRYSPEVIKKFQDGSDPYLYPNVSWIDELWRKNSYQSINNLNVNGGTELITYYVNVGYTYQNGLYKVDDQNTYNTNANLNRYNFRSRVDMNLSKNFSVSLGVGGNIQQRNSPANPTNQIFETIQSTSPIAYPIRNPDGTPGGVPQDGIQGLNPWAVITQNGYRSNHYNTLQSTFTAKWDLSSLLTKGLSLNGRFGYDHYSAGGPNRGKLHEIKQYLGKDPVTNEDMYAIHREGEALRYAVSYSGNRALYSESSLNYERKFGIHGIGAMLLYNQRDLVDITASNTIANLPQRHQGVAGRVTYDFDNRYFAEFNFGYNGSENFPKGNRFGFFPSVSAGWLISNEKFWQIPAINQFKIRASHGQAGNDRTDGTRYLFLTTVITTGTNYYPYGLDMNFISGIEEWQLGNENVTWEVSTKSNVGIDLGLFQNKISLQMDVFRENRKGILIQRQDIPSMPGFFGNKPYGNLGETKNRGIDGQLVFKSSANDFRYNLMVNATYAKNTIIENDEPKTRYAYQTGKGYSISQARGLVALGLFKDEADIDASPTQTFGQVRPGDIKYQDVNSDGRIDLFDIVPIGSPRNPELMYGFGGTIEYKSFDLSLFFTGVTKTSFFFGQNTMQPFNRGEANILREYYDNRWIPGGNNASAKYPAVIHERNSNNFIDGVTSTLWQRDGSFLRFKNAEIGFTLPASISKRLRFQTARFFVNGMNLYTWDKIKVVDPETDDSDGGYPISRTLNLGIDVKF